MGDLTADNHGHGTGCPMPRRVLPLLVVGLCAMGAALLVLAAVPPVSRDALTHHLLVPKLYLAHGGIYEIPSIVFSYFPMNLDLLYAIPLYFGNDIAPKFIHMAFGLMTAWLIFAHLKKRLNTAYGLLGALLFLSLPVIVKLSITVYVDLGLIFFSTVAVLCLIKWVENPFQTRHLVWSAIGCGLALGTKYNGLIVLFLLALMVPFSYLQTTAKRPKDSMRAVGYSVLFTVVALLVFSPWMARNLAWKGNPIYPLHDSWFKSLRAENPGQGIQSVLKKNTAVPLSHFTYRHLAYGESEWQIAAVPLRVFFQGRDDSPRLFDGQLNPSLLIFPLIAGGFIRRDRASVRIEKMTLATFAVLFLFYTFFTIDMRVRYLAPIIGPLVILSVWGVHDLVNSEIGRHAGVSKQRFAGFLTVILVLFFIPNVLYIIEQFGRVKPVEYLTGRVGRDDYIQRYRAEYAVLVHANRYLSPKAKILGLFLGNRLYYSDRYIVDSIGLFAALVNGARTPADLCHKIQMHGFSHLLIRTDLFERWGQDNYDQRQRKILQCFFQTRVKMVISRDGYGLMALTGSD